MKSRYHGPRLFVRVASSHMDPLGLDRLGQLKERAGIGPCNITKRYTEVRPEDIHITDDTIIPLEERIVDRDYDPVTMLFGRLRPRRKGALIT